MIQLVLSGKPANRPSGLPYGRIAYAYAQVQKKRTRSYAIFSLFNYQRVSIVKREKLDQTNVAAFLTIMPIGNFSFDFKPKGCFRLQASAFSYFEFEYFTAGVYQ